MNIKVDLSTNIQNGTEIVFRSPANCSEVTGLIVHYIDDAGDNSKEFIFADAHGEDIGNINNLFTQDAVVKVILDVDRSKAYIVTNSYIEQRLNKPLWFNIKVWEDNDGSDIVEWWNYS